MGDNPHSSVNFSLTLLQLVICSGERWNCFISSTGSRYMLFRILDTGETVLGAVK